MMFFHKAFDITPKIAQKRITEETVYLLDVRNPKEYQEGHIPQAHLIPLPELNRRLQEIPKDIPIFVYCRSGQRANTAKCVLQQAGYQDVYNIGGVMKWPYRLES